MSQDKSKNDSSNVQESIQVAKEEKIFNLQETPIAKVITQTEKPVVQGPPPPPPEKPAAKAEQNTVEEK